MGAWKTKAPHSTTYFFSLKLRSLPSISFLLKAAILFWCLMLSISVSLPPKTTNIYYIGLGSWEKEPEMGFGADLLQESSLRNVNKEMRKAGTEGKGVYQKCGLSYRTSGWAETNLWSINQL